MSIAAIDIGPSDNIEETQRKLLENCFGNEPELDAYTLASRLVEKAAPAGIRIIRVFSYIKILEKQVLLMSEEREGKTYYKIAPREGGNLL